MIKDGDFKMSNYNYNTLCHHGIKGQKWGIRRFQNEDGTLTAAGRKRYDVAPSGEMTEKGKKLYKQDLKDDKLSKRSTGGNVALGATKAGTLTAIGSAAAIGAIALIGMHALKKIDKNDSSSIDDVLKFSSNGLRVINKLSTAGKMAVPIAATAGAAVAYKKQQNARERSGYNNVATKG